MYKAISIFFAYIIYIAFVSSNNCSLYLCTGNQAYGLASRLSTIANPLACFVALFIPRVSITTISVLVGIGAFMSGYQLYLAAMSPYPPWQEEAIGVALVVCFIIHLFTGKVLNINKLFAKIRRQKCEKEMQLYYLL